MGIKLLKLASNILELIAENVKEEYRRQYYAALGSVIACINERFEQKD